MKFFGYLFFGFMFVFLAACSSQEVDRLLDENNRLQREARDMRQQLEQNREPAQRLDRLASFLNGIKARIETNHGDIEVEFYPDKAPIHVYSFITRAESGFYNGTQFHRVIPGFMIQGGDPNSKDGDKLNNGQGGPINSIPHEFNDIEHVRGILSMARVGDVEAGAGSQFFIMHDRAAHLDNQYTAFGRVTSGLDVVDSIATTETYGRQNQRLSNHPVEPAVIERIVVFR